MEEVLDLRNIEYPSEAYQNLKGVSAGTCIVDESVGMGEFMEKYGHGVLETGSEAWKKFMVKEMGYDKKWLRYAVRCDHIKAEEMDKKGKIIQLKKFMYSNSDRQRFLEHHIFATSITWGDWNIVKAGLIVIPDQKPRLIRLGVLSNYAD